jgi:mono/diheme cytochrome c family protein
MRTSSIFAAAALALASLSASAEIDPKAQKLFKTKCAACHGANGKGDTDMGRKGKAPDFTDAGFQKRATDEGIKSVIKDGQKADKKIADHAFADKVGDQLDNVVKVVRAFGK